MAQKACRKSIRATIHLIPTKVKLTDFEKRKSDQDDSKTTERNPIRGLFRRSVGCGSGVSPQYVQAYEEVFQSPSGDRSMVAVTRQNPLADITGSSGWGLLPMYYLVQYNDLQTGKLLEHPIVRRIRVSDRASFPRPKNLISVDEKPTALGVMGLIERR